jgi:hypothetical protein
MPLTLRPTGLGHGVYKDSIGYSVFSSEWNIGRIYERHGFPDAVRFFWSLHGVVLTKPPGIHTDGTLLPLRRRKQSSRAIGFVGWSGQSGQRLNDQA